MDSGFQTRTVNPSLQPPRRGSGMPPRRGGSGWKGRFEGIRGFLKRRGRKQLTKDVILTAGGAAVLYVLFLWLTLPDISNQRKLIASQSSVIVDRNGTELYRLFSEQDRIFLDGKDIPKHMKDAIVAIEDERFYTRGCLDIQALGRMVFTLGRTGGASTLTRQLARNALDLQKDGIITRKLKELILGCQLERKYTKDKLVDLYLNWIPFGQNAYGVELAAKRYFGIPAKDLTLAQSAVLAALPQRPTYFSPYGKHVRTSVTPAALEKIKAGAITSTSQLTDEDYAIGLLGNRIGSGATAITIGGRADQVLRNMQDQGYIKDADRLQALKETETMAFKPARENIRAPHFVLWVRAQVEEMLSGRAEEGMIDQGGLTIETTLDWELQQIAEQAVTAKKDDYLKLYGVHNISLVAADPNTKEIVAYVGNGDYNDEEHDGKVDMARAPRQPGSSFKPLVYAAAFEKGYGPATVIYDVATKIGVDEPSNFDGKFWGVMTARRALGSSRNIPAAKAFFMAGGEKQVLDMASRLGASTPKEFKDKRLQTDPDFEYGWPLALGAADTPLTEMTEAYATLAAGGKHAPLISIKRIRDRFGKVFYENDALDEESQVMDTRIAYQVTSVLSDVSARPNEYWQSVLSVPGFQAAAKTGTSNKSCPPEEEKSGKCKILPTNLWTMGYTPSLVAGVWAGNADATALSPKAESLITAAPIWKEFMTKAHKVLKAPKTSFTVPSGIVQPQISLLSGELPTECTPVSQRKSDVFLSERAPQNADPACLTLTVDRVTGLLASDECPADARIEQSFFMPGSILADRWPSWEEGVQKWAASQAGSWDPLTGSFTGSSLPLPLAPTKKCELSMTPGRLEQPTVRIVSPQQGGTVSFPSFRPKLDIDVASSVREIVFTIDGRQITKITGSGGSFEPALQMPRSLDEAGTHTLEVTVVDRYFNKATDSVSFRFGEDSSAPSVGFITPSGDLSLVSGTKLRIEAEARDIEGGIKYVEFYLDNQLLTRKPREPFEFSYDLDLPPGTYLLRAVATDLAGRTGEDRVEVTVEP
jgi:membrane peptidoglycan carboxypeptidase